MRDLLFGCVLTMLTTPAFASDCSILPKSRMALRLTVDGLPFVVAPEIRSVVEQVWAAEGLTFAWAPADVGADAWSGIDVWIAVVNRRAPHGHVLGDVQFHGDVPSRLVRVYADAVVRWLSDDARRFRAASRLGDLRAGKAVLAQALGNVAAHELGHFVLGVRTHAAKGLMQEQFMHSPVSVSRAALQLDSAGRRLLRARLEARAAC